MRRRTSAILRRITMKLLKRDTTSKVGLKKRRLKASNRASAAPAVKVSVAPLHAQSEASSPFIR
jgi:hypothetical protein